MSSTLSRIPSAKRRQLAATLGLFAVLFVAVGSVAATGANTAPIKAFVIVAIVVALLLALMGWGVATSIRQDEAEQSLDAAVQEVLAAAPNRMCDCGHDHDPDEMHVVDEPLDKSVDASVDPCAHDGHGVACTHSCDTCVLASLRPSPARPREHAPSDAPAARPAPRPRPAARRPAPTAR